jgi:hypothetical protein
MITLLAVHHYRREENRQVTPMLDLPRPNIRFERCHRSFGLIMGKNAVGFKIPRGLSVRHHDIHHGTGLEHPHIAPNTLHHVEHPFPLLRGSAGCARGNLQVVEKNWNARCTRASPSEVVHRYLRVFVQQWMPPVARGTDEYIPHQATNRLQEPVPLSRGHHRQAGRWEAINVIDQHLVEQYSCPPVMSPDSRHPHVGVNMVLPLKDCPWRKVVAAPRPVHPLSF